MEILVKIFRGVVLIAVIALVMALPTMWLWNWLMPLIFGWIKINFWQALGVNFLTGILFKINNKFLYIRFN